MALSDYGRNNTISEACIRTITHPLTNLICIAAAVSVAAFISVPTGIPAYMLAPVGFMLAIMVDPAELVSRFRARRLSGRDAAGCTRSCINDWKASGNGWSLRVSRRVGHLAHKAPAERRRCKGMR